MKHIVSATILFFKEFPTRLWAPHLGHQRKWK